MEILALLLLILCCLIGIFAVFFTTFGTLCIMVGALLFAAMTDFSILTIQHLIFLSGLYLIGEGFEFVATVVGTKWMGGSNLSVLGSLFGGFAGAIFGLATGGVSIFVTTLAGLFLGAFLVELGRKKDLSDAIRVGLGSMLGRISAVFFKLLIAAAMLALITFPIFAAATQKALF